MSRCQARTYGARYLAVPALAPVSGYYSAIIAMPILSAPAAIMAALPIAGMVPLVTIGYAVFALPWRREKSPARAMADGAVGEG